MEVAGVLNTILKQQKEFQIEIRSEFRSMKDEFIKMEERQNRTDEKINRIVTKVDEKIDILTSQTNNAVEVILGKLANMDEKLNKNIVVKYETDFITEKIQYLEKEIFKLKQ